MALLSKGLKSITVLMTNTVVIKRAKGLGDITLSNVTGYDVWILDIGYDGI